ncbi:hypothetical protein LO80_04255 [Candidatus Francisella endociliophora]|uniref:Thaumarchaeal output domain-containing protein n=1 Tax=Candidatus Francisella endociliophora TaxID=653937 RepID=A0A097ENW4_9GAMM|nr:hypothetical protein [Francisella sp. FSC1006]AIT09257.1 hypothetical protein LO80_04255 [Francisella sp. FSC1006]
MSRDLNIAILNTTSLDVRDKLSKCSIKEFSTKDEISTDFENIDAIVLDHNSTTTSNVDAFVIDPQDQDEFITLLKKIRSSIYTYLKPVFCTNADYIDYTTEPFTDIETIASFIDTVNHEVSTIEQISQNADNISRDWQARLLIYLYTRRSIRHLKPCKNKIKKSFFSYPVIDVFSQDANFDYYEWIKELKDRDILKFKKFVKSFFCCSNCSSAKALFSEICPECKSEDVLLEDFLHCYTCGNISPEAQFISTSDELICSQCKSKLKHIGVDYDRPLESYSCMSCDSIFIEPEVITECIDCNTITLTEKMKKQKVNEYSLTNKAQRYIRMNLLEYSMSVFDEINYVVPEFFYNLIEWAYSMQDRDKAYEFSLIYINVFDYVNITDISTLSKSLKNALRKTDMLTRCEKNQCIWVWLPNTTLEGAKIVADKLKHIHMSEGDNLKDAIEIKTFYSTDIEDFTAPNKVLEKLARQG